MKFIKLLSVALFAASLLAGPAFAADNTCPAKAQDQKGCCPAKAESQKGCCPAKAEDQKKCNGEKGCPFKDAKNGKPCETAQPKKADEKK